MTGYCFSRFLSLAAKTKQVENQVIQQSNYLGSTTFLKNYTDNKINEILLTASAASSSCGAHGPFGWLVVGIALVTVKTL